MNMKLVYGKSRDYRIFDYRIYLRACTQVKKYIVFRAKWKFSTRDICSDTVPVGSQALCLFVSIKLLLIVHESATVYILTLSAIYLILWVIMISIYWNHLMWHWCID